MWLSLLKWAGAHKIALGALAAVIAVAALAWGALVLRQAGYDAGAAAVQTRWDAAVRADEAEARADERLIQRAVDAIGGRLTADLSRLKIEHKTINRSIVDEVRTVPVYSECRVSDGLWHNLNQLRAATDPGAAGRGGDPVPAAAADP